MPLICTLRGTKFPVPPLSPERKADDTADLPELVLLVCQGPRSIPSCGGMSGGHMAAPTIATKCCTSGEWSRVRGESLGSHGQGSPLS